MCLGPWASVSVVKFVCTGMLRLSWHLEILSIQVCPFMAKILETEKNHLVKSGCV